MAGNLQDAVCRRVDDGFACLPVFFTQFLDDYGAAGMFFAEHAGQVPFLHEGIHEFRREAFRLVRKIAPVEPHRHAGDFPVAAQGVLALADFLGTRVSRLDTAAVQRVRLDRFPGQGMHQDFPRTQFMGFFQAQRSQMRQEQVLRRTVRLFAVGRHPIRDMPQRVGAFVAESLCIVGIADAEGIQYRDDDSRHVFCHTFPQSLSYCYTFIVPQSAPRFVS